MSKFIVNGGRRLSGCVDISGSKNAALPIIFACITVHGISVLDNLPEISDVDVAFDILSCFGASVERNGSVATVDTRRLCYCIPPEHLVSRIRASSYLVGACLARFGRAHILRYGGCDFDNRPIDMHLSAAAALGASVYDGEICAERLIGGEIYFDKISVGATVNSLLMAASADGVSKIFGYAREPHVFSLIDFLSSAGAVITVHDWYIEVIGARLHGASVSVIPDMIEAGTFISLSLATASDIWVCGEWASELSSFLRPLIDAGAVIEFGNGMTRATGQIDEPISIETAPYPGFPTDLQPIVAPLMAICRGGEIRERVWRQRFGYLKDLSSFGIASSVADGSAVILPSELHAASVSARDLRGGAALLISALASKGKSVIGGAELIWRGYADIVSKLVSLGADIREI